MHTVNVHQLLLFGQFWNMMDGRRGQKVNLLKIATRPTESWMQAYSGSVFDHANSRDIHALNPIVI